MENCSLFFLLKSYLPEYILYMENKKLNWVYYYSNIFWTIFLYVSVTLLQH
jgi:hypothetical protein